MIIWSRLNEDLLVLSIAYWLALGRTQAVCTMYTFHSSHLHFAHWTFIENSEHVSSIAWKSSKSAKWMIKHQADSNLRFHSFCLSSMPLGKSESPKLPLNSLCWPLFIQRCRAVRWLSDIIETIQRVRVLCASIERARFQMFCFLTGFVPIEFLYFMFISMRNSRI